MKTPVFEATLTMTQEDFILKYFLAHPDRDIPHAEIVDWVTAEYEKEFGRKFRDPDRAIRKLHQQGVLIKIRKGVYRYEPNNVQKRELEDFSAEVKKQILERDGYRCVVCGRGKAEGLEVHVDHIKPKDKGGKATLDNGQTLCAAHNFRKKNYEQTESGKRMFMLMYGLAQKAGDEDMMRFIEDVLKVYEAHDINGHIEWKPKKSQDTLL